MTTWKNCGQYHEMYELRHTWHSIECGKGSTILNKPDSCEGCPMKNEIYSKDMLKPGKEMK